MLNTIDTHYHITDLKLWMQRSRHSGADQGSRREGINKPLRRCGSQDLSNPTSADYDLLPTELSAVPGKASIAYALRLREFGNQPLDLTLHRSKNPYHRTTILTD
jgi:hypothetical protein